MLARSRSYVDVERIVHDIASCDVEAGTYVETFERRFARYIGAPRCIATNQGRAALLLALHALNPSVGDEVIVQSFTYPGVIGAILDAGATPVLADNSLEDFSAAASGIRERITERTKAIIATHLFGIPCDIGGIADVADEYGCCLIEDCAQCLGARYEGRNVGTYGDMAFVSFNYEKHLPTGEGGMLVINNRDLLDRIGEVVEGYRRRPIDEERCCVYGLLVQHFATEKSVCRSGLSAYFGYETCSANPRLLAALDGLIRDEASEEALRQAVAPCLSPGEGDGGPIRPARRRGTYVRTAATRLLSLRDAVRSRVVPVDYPRIESPYLLMNSLRAVVGMAGLESVDRVNGVRNQNARRIIEFLQETDVYVQPTVTHEKEPAFLKYSVLNNTRHPLPHLIKTAVESGLEIRNAQWTQPVHRLHEYRRRVVHTRRGLPVSEYLAGHILNIPNHCYITPDDIEDIASFLRLFAPEKPGLRTGGQPIRTESTG